MRIAITGANGFVGNELVHYFLAEGNEVWLLQRKKPQMPYARAVYKPYHLDDTSTIPDLTGVDVLIHTAYIAYEGDKQSTVANIKGTIALYEVCQAKGIYFIFLSSLSAHKGAISQYGKHKFELEKKLDKRHCLILKLGLVIGNRGLFNRIKQSVMRTRLALMIGGGNQPVQTIFISDVARVIDKCIHTQRTGIFNVATPRVYSMKDLFSTVAKKAGKTLIFIPIPYFIAETGIRLIELLHLPFPVSSENLLGLKQLRPFSTQPDLEELDIELTDLEESVSRLM